MDHNDPRETFQADQAEAERTEQSREQAAWDLNMRNGIAQARQAEAVAESIEQRAAFWQACERAMAAFTTALWAAFWLGLGYATAEVIRAFPGVS